MEHPLKVYITDTPYDDIDIESQLLKNYQASVKSLSLKSDHEIVKECADANILLNLVAPINEKVFSSLPDLIGVVRYGTGYDNVDIPSATEHGIVVANIPQYGQDEVAEHTAALILSSWRKISYYNNSISNGVWNWKIGRPIHPINGKTLGLVGFGRIAKMVASKMKGFGMVVQIYDPFVGEEQCTTLGVKKVSLEDLASSSDVISVHTPLTKETYHIISRKEVSVMKGCIFVNASRGPIVDEDALIDGLNSGKISSAALDVLEKEPESRSKFAGMDNVIFTPHIGWYSEESMIDLRTKVAKTAISFIEKKLPSNVINMEAVTHSKWFQKTA